MLANWRKRVIDELSQRVYEMVIWPDHFLRQVNAKVEFSFINELCAPAYHNGTGKGGRAAEAPERVFRALLLLVLYGYVFGAGDRGQSGFSLVLRVGLAGADV
jgi:hypothetical protein